MGFPILGDALEDGYGLYDWDTKMIEAVIETCRGTRVTRAGFRACDYRELIDALRNNPVFPVGVMERAAAHTEYVPWARQLIACDDGAEAAQRGRVVGRSTRSGARHVRTIEVDTEVRRGLERSSFGRIDTVVSVN